MVKDDPIGWLTKNGLDRHRPVFMAMQVSLLIVGFFFWFDATVGAHGFKESTWGSFAYAIPAKFWALYNMAVSAITIVGLRKPVKHLLVSMGAFLHCLQFIILSFSTTLTGGEVVIGLYAGSFFLPLHLWLFYEAVRNGHNNS